MDNQNRAEAVAKAHMAFNALETLDPYFRAVEAFYVERLVAVSGWRSWWRGDRRRAEAAERIKALRDVKNAVQRVIDQGKVASAPPAPRRL